MRKLFVLISALPLLACASESPPPASDKEERAVSKAYLDCLMSASIKLDDQRSDASTIGLAAEGSCANEWIANKEVFGRSMNPAARKLFYAKVDATQ